MSSWAGSVELLSSRAKQLEPVELAKAMRGLLQILMARGRPSGRMLSGTCARRMSGVEHRQRGPYRKGVEQRQRILEEAASIFARRGFAGSSLRTIAAAVGVSHASIVQLFGTKEALLLAVLAEWDLDLQVRLEGTEGIAFLESLERVMAVNEQQPGMVELFLVMAAEATDPAHPARSFILERSERVRLLVERHLQIAADAGDLRALSEQEIVDAAREVTAMMNGLELQWLLRSPRGLQEPFGRYLKRWIRDLR